MGHGSVGRLSKTYIRAEGLGDLGGGGPDSKTVVPFETWTRSELRQKKSTEENEMKQSIMVEVDILTNEATKIDSLLLWLQWLVKLKISLIQQAQHSGILNSERIVRSAG